MGVFTRNYIKSQYSGSGENFYRSQELFEALEKLHKLWFQSNELEKRFSGKAEDKRNNFIADFYVLAEKVLNQIITIYKNWADGHTKEGWWDRWALEWFSSTPTLTRSNGVVDMGSFVKQKIEEQYINSINWFDEFKESQHDHGASEFLKQIYDKIDLKQLSGAQKQLIDRAISFEDDGLGHQMIGELGMIRKFYDWSVKNEYYAASYDIEDLWGEDWYEDMLKDRGRRDEIIEILQTPEALDYAWKQWIKIWPNYERTLVLVQGILDELNSIRGIANPNKIMEVLTRALNIAHNSGLMYEHLGLDEGQMEDLSNLSTRDWSNEIKHYSKKIVALYNNTKWK